VRVAVADDNRLFREGLVLLLEKIGVRVAAQAADGQDIVHAVAKDAPDVVILDIVMPPGDYGGLIAAESLHQNHPDVGLLLLSGYDSTQFALRLFSCDGAGGRGYLIKDRVTCPNTLRDTLASIASGAMSVDPEIAKRLLNPKSHKSVLDGLTDREIEVLELVAQGSSNKGIAERLGLSTKTVDRHVSNICDKFDIPGNEANTRRSLILLKYFQATHVCDARCASPCRFAVPTEAGP
jgi:DNA-binding NarL/FixJ family response regulator